jgi:spermidine/putrescine transport system permease protein
MIGATLLGTSAALALIRTHFPGRKLFDALTYLPLIMPEIVLGLSLLIWFVLLKITLGTVSIILAHITFSVSYVIITVKSRLHGFDESLEEAARDLGATRWGTFWRITFPLIWPGVLSGALMAFTLSFDDFLITFFTAGVGSDTLPLKIYSMIKFGVTPEINALSTLILALTLVMVLLFFKPIG